MAEYRQTYTNSCGAAALLCAAHELGVDQIAQVNDYSLWQDAPLALELNRDCETRLYQVTSGDPPALNPNHWGYSMPSGIVTCAALLNLEARVVAEPTWTVRVLKFAYPEEMTRLRQINALNEPRRCFFGNHSRIRPDGNERELRVLLSRQRETMGQMHYVMIRPDGSVMEPGDGENHGTIRAAKTEVGMHGTGLSIFVRRTA